MSTTPPSHRRIAAVEWKHLKDIGHLLEKPLARVLATESSPTVLSQFLRANRHFSSIERQISAESIFGVAIWQRRLLAQCPHHTPHPLDLLATLVASLGQRPQVFSWLNRPAFEFLPIDEHTAPALAFPDWLLEQMAGQVSDAPHVAAEAFNRPGPVFLRTNTRLIDRTTLAKQLAAEKLDNVFSASTAQGLRVTVAHPNIFGSPAHQRGHFEVQDEGSQRLGEMVQATPGDSVLDLCAGAGGKTLQLACTGADVFACDIDTEKLLRLKTRAQKAKATVTVLGASPSTDARFDWVLVDAPCSQSGTLRRSPDLRNRLQPDDVKRWVTIQLQLLRKAAAVTKPGGHLVYGTCSFLSAENDAVVNAFLNEDQQFTWNREHDTLRTWPHLHDTDAFFGARLQRLVVTSPP